MQEAMGLSLAVVDLVCNKDLDKTATPLFRESDAAQLCDMPWRSITVPVCVALLQ